MFLLVFTTNGANLTTVDVRMTSVAGVVLKVCAFDQAELRILVYL